MRTETPRIRQLTFQLGHAPCVLTRGALAAKTAAPSHPLAAGRKTDKQNPDPVFLYSRDQERRFLPGPGSGVSAPETG